MMYLPDEMWDIIYRELYKQGEYNLGPYIVDHQTQRVVARINQDYAWVQELPCNNYMDYIMEMDLENFE